MMVNPKKLSRYPSDRLILLEIARQLTSAYDNVRKQHKKTWVWPITIGEFEVKQKQDIMNFDSKWDQYPFKDYNFPHPFLTILESSDFGRETICA